MRLWNTKRSPNCMYRNSFKRRIRYAKSVTSNNNVFFLRVNHSMKSMFRLFSWNFANQVPGGIKLNSRSIIWDHNSRFTEKLKVYPHGLRSQLWALNAFMMTWHGIQLHILSLIHHTIDFWKQWGLYLLVVWLNTGDVESYTSRIQVIPELDDTSNHKLTYFPLKNQNMLSSNFHLNIQSS